MKKQTWKNDLRRSSNRLLTILSLSGPPVRPETLLQLYISAGLAYLGDVL